LTPAVNRPRDAPVIRHPVTGHSGWRHSRANGLFLRDVAAHLHRWYLFLTCYYPYVFRIIADHLAARLSDGMFEAIMLLHTKLVYGKRLGGEVF
jgi:hypothetical protein